MNLVPIVVGAALLFFGYRYYWLIFGGIGFLLGLNMGSAPGGGQITPSAIVLGMFFGVIGAFTAVFLTALTLNIAGFVLGGVVLVQLFANLGWDTGSTLVTFLMGGMIGLLIAINTKDFAKILLSSVTGAAIIVMSLEIDSATVSFLYLVLVISGIVAQLFLRKRWK
jgi:hypothetical protein